MKSRINRIPKGLLIFLISCGLYVNTIGHDFVLDDSIVITENMFTQQGFAGWKGLLTNDTFYGFFKEEGKQQLVTGGRYRPLSLMIFAIVYQLLGNNPMAFHLLAILLYGVCCLLLFQFLKLFFNQLNGQGGEWIAFIAALIYTVHPVHTEVVANIKGADETLSTIGALVCLISLIYYQKEKKWTYLLYACLSFFLSLMSKENTVTLLAVAPMTLWMTGGKASVNQLTWPVLSLLGVFTAYFVIRSSVIGWFGLSNTPMELMNNPFLKYDGPNLVSVSFSEWLGTIFYTLGYYIKLLLFPHPLSHDYYPRAIPIVSMTNIWSILSLLLHLASGIWAIFHISRKNVLAYGVLFYLFSMSITSNLLFPVGTNMSERFLFLPSIGASIVFGYALYQLVRRNQMIGWSVVLLLGLAFSFKTVLRNNAWKDNFTLFQTDVSHSPNSAKVRNAAAGSMITAYGGLPEGEQKNNIMEQAIGHLKVALDIHPLYKNAHLLKGNAHLYKNEFDDAIRSYHNALKIDPSYRDAKNNLFIAYRAGGRYFGETKGDLDKALDLLLKAYEINPTDTETIRLLGVTYGVRGGHRKAIEYFTKLVEIKPENAEYWRILGTAYHSNGQIEERNAALEKAKELDPERFDQIIQEQKE